MRTPRSRSWRPLGWRRLLASSLMLAVAACSGGGGGGGGGGPAAPLGLAAALVSSSEVDLVWSYGSGEVDSFRIQRASDAAGSPGPFGLVGSVAGAARHYQDAGLAEGETYWYRVLAVLGGETSAPSNLLQVTTAGTLPGLQSPGALAASGLSSSQIRLTWEDQSSAEQGFKIERAPGQSGPFSQVAQVAAGVEHYEDGGLEPDASYRYRVRAYAGSSASPYSNVAQGKTLPSSPVAAGIELFSLAKTQSEPELILEEDGRSYLYCASEPANTILIALEASGSLRWERELVGRYRFARASDGDLWMMTEALYSPPDFGLAAGKVSAADGKILWELAYGAGGSWLVPDRSPHAAPLERLEFVAQESTFAGICLGVVGSDGALEWDLQAFLGATSTHLPDGDRLVRAAAPDELNVMARLDPNGTPEWKLGFYKTGGGNSPEILEAFGCSDGGTALFGAFDVKTAWIAKVDEAGALVSQLSLTAPVMWVATVATAADVSGGGFVATRFFSSPWVFAFDSQGDLRWRRQVDTPATEFVDAVVPRVGGGCFLVGLTDYGLPSSEWDAWVVALDANGDLEWERILGLGENDSILAARACSGGALLVAGNSYADSGFANTWVATLSDQGQITGQAAWVEAQSTAVGMHLDPRPGGGWLLAGVRLTALTTADLFVVGISDEGAIERSVLVPNAGNSLFGASEVGALGVGPQGEVRALSTVLTQSFDTELVASTLDLHGSPVPLAAGAACAQELAFSTTALLAAGGVATSVDNATEITSTVWATSFVYSSIGPANLTPAPVSTSSYPAAVDAVTVCEP